MEEGEGANVRKVGGGRNRARKSATDFSGIANKNLTVLTSAQETGHAPSTETS